MRLLDWIAEHSRGEYMSFGMWMTGSILLVSTIGTLCAIPILLILWGAGLL